MSNKSMAHKWHCSSHTCKPTRLPVGRVVVPGNEEFPQAALRAKPLPYPILCMHGWEFSRLTRSIEYGPELHVTTPVGNMISY